MSATFGVVVAACDSDLHLAKATLASVRHHMPDVPICLVYDGTRALGRAERAYDLTIIRRADVIDRRLRERSFGFGLTKMIAWWEAPFERVLYLESDTVALGDLREIAPAEEVDVLVDVPEVCWGEPIVDKHFFDPVQLELHVPSFDWRLHIPDLMTPGTFFFRRGCLSLDRYVDLIDLHARTGMFRAGEQGILNLMLFEAADAGYLCLNQRQFQTLVCDFPRHEIEERFRLDVPRPWVLHWAGPSKKYARRSRIHTFFRRQFLRDTRRKPLLAGALMRSGDARWLIERRSRHTTTRCRLAARRLLGRARRNPE